MAPLPYTYNKNCTFLILQKHAENGRSLLDRSRIFLRFDFCPNLANIFIMKVSWYRKIDHFLKKYAFVIFQIGIIQTSPLQKVLEKKDCFYAKIWTKKGC